MSIDVTSINSIEGLLLTNIISGFSTLTGYASHLLYYFTAFEIIFAGFAWVLYQNQYAERLFSQLIKIGVVLFIIENFTSLINSILGSALTIGAQLSHGGIQNVLLNPGILWQYGYNFAVSLLQVSASAEGFSLPLILMVMGFGILFVVAILGIQVFVQVVSFYLVAAMSLIFLPLSVFSPLRDFLSQSMKSLLQATVRLMVQMLIVSAALAVWSEMSLQNFTPDMNINQPLGFLFSGLLFVLASAYLPRVAEKVIGGIQWQAAPMPTQSVVVSTAAVGVGGAGSGSSTINLPSAQVAALMSHSSSAAAQAAMATQVPASVSVYTNAVKGEFQARQAVMQGGQPLVARDRFDEQQQKDLQRIKQAFHEVLKELREEKAEQ